jgi:hypothetical protein
MLTDFTFKDTGITIKIKKISPMLAADVSAAMPEPLPPEQEVDYGEPRGKVMERNYSDPNYQSLVIEHRRKLYATLQRAMILRSVTVDGDDWKEDVKEYKSFIQSQTGGLVDEENDLVLYVTRVCVGSQADLNDLMAAITRRSQPTEEAVTAAKADFRG